MTGGALLAFSWAVAEATVWPIMPDALTVPMALHRPRSWWQLVAGAMLGTALGGAVSYLLGRLHSDPSPVERLWLVRPAMVTATSGWLREDGARGAWRQPATGVPFKVFARLAGHHGLPPLPFLGWAVLSRTVRFLVLTRTAALIGGRLPAHARNVPWLLSVVWIAGFGLALWRTVLYWERRHQR